MTTLTQPSYSIKTQPTSTTGEYVSEAQYWAEYYNHPDINYEWNNGYLEEKPVASYLQAAMYAWFLDILRRYLEVHPIARLTMLEIGFRMALPHKTTVRKPDLGLVLNNNAVPLHDHDRSYRGVFDLCVESLSDSSKKEVERDTVHKFSEYQLAGIQEYYILDERGPNMAFLQNVNGVYQPIQPQSGIIQSTVLPGFQFRVDDLYRRPTMIALTLDSVYQEFLLPEYQAERRAREEEKRAKEIAQQRLLDTARNLLPLMDDPTISQITGLEITVVQQLREE